MAKRLDQPIKAISGRTRLVAEMNAIKLCCYPLDDAAHGRVLDDHLAKNSVAVGKTLTVADFALAAALPFATAAGIPVAEFRHIQTWYGRLEELDAWQNPFPA